MSIYDEPWKTEDRGTTCHRILDKDGKWIIDTDLFGDRITACVNACAGVDDPEARQAKLVEIAKKLRTLAADGAVSKFFLEWAEVLDPS